VRTPKTRTVLVLGPGEEMPSLRHESGPPSKESSQKAIASRQVTSLPCLRPKILGSLWICSV
jgi:hypothetical protein